MLKNGGENRSFGFEEESHGESDRAYRFAPAANSGEVVDPE
jgi:hypothetical protein